MDYIIYTPSARRLKKEILGSTSAQTDAYNDATTWKCVKTEANDNVLVYTPDRWAEKGFITIKANLAHNELRVRFCYWDSCEERNSDDERFMLGRFTEHLLVHYSYFVDRVVIE